jgi:hypothetical protein
VFNSPTNLVDPLGNQGVIPTPLAPVTPIFPRVQDNQNLPRIPGYPGSPNSTDSLLIQLEDRLGDVGKGLSRFIPSIFPFTGKPPEKDDELKGGTKPKPSPTLNPPPIRKPTPEPDEEPIPFLLPKAPNPNSCECEKSKRENKTKGITVYFGQKRIDPTFKDKRPLDETKRQLENCQILPKDLLIKVFDDPFGSGKLVAEGNRRLAALSLAGLRPTKIEKIGIRSIRDRNGEYPLEVRINEDPLPGFPKLPSPIIAVTPNKTDLTVLRTIRIP